MTESNRSENQNKRQQPTVDPDHQQSRVLIRIVSGPYGYRKYGILQAQR